MSSGYSIGSFITLFPDCRSFVPCVAVFWGCRFVPIAIHTPFISHSLAVNGGEGLRPALSADAVRRRLPSPVHTALRPSAGVTADAGGPSRRPGTLNFVGNPLLKFRHWYPAAVSDSYRGNFSRSNEFVCLALAATDCFGGFRDPIEQLLVHCRPLWIGRSRSVHHYTWTSVGHQ